MRSFISARYVSDVTSSSFGDMSPTAGSPPCASAAFFEAMTRWNPASRWCRFSSPTLGWDCARYCIAPSMSCVALRARSAVENSTPVSKLEMTGPSAFLFIARETWGRHPILRARIFPPRRGQLRYPRKDMHSQHSLGLALLGSPLESPYLILSLSLSCAHASEEKKAARPGVLVNAISSMNDSEGCNR
jgi:hypothetical protein